MLDRYIKGQLNTKNDLNSMTFDVNHHSHKQMSISVTEMGIIQLNINQTEEI